MGRPKWMKAEAERAFKKWLEADDWVAHRAQAAHAVRKVKGSRKPHHFVNSHDVWGAIDIAAMHADVGFWYVQVTTQAGVNARRRKVEALPWPFGVTEGLRVSIAEARQRRDDKDRRRWVRYFQIHDFDGVDWTTTDTIYPDAHIAAEGGTS